MSQLPAEVRLAALAWAPDDAETVRRYRAKIVAVPGSGCRWWSGALSGRGHGRFWLASVDGRDVVVVAHRFGFALVHGVEELERETVLGHRCDNPLCQRIGTGHDWTRYTEISVLNRGVSQADGSALTNDNVIRVGWILTLPADAHNPPAAAAAVVRVTVQSGETVSEIAAREGADDWRADVWDVNAGRAEPGGDVFSNPNHIEPGWVLDVRVDDAVQPAAPPPAQTADPIPTPPPAEETPPPIPPPTGEPAPGDVAVTGWRR